MPKGIRPTEQKVRKATFDILGEFVQDAGVLELFAGSGAVGIEAISLGAREVYFAEKDIRCVKLIRENLKSLGIESFDLAAKDALTVIKFLSDEGKSFDIVFLDPPYYKDLAKKALLAIASYAIVKPYGFVIVQHYKDDNLEDSIESLSLYTRRRYGTTILSFYRRK